MGGGFFHIWHLQDVTKKWPCWLTLSHQNVFPINHCFLKWQSLEAHFNVFYRNSRFKKNIESFIQAVYNLSPQTGVERYSYLSESVISDERKASCISIMTKSMRLSRQCDLHFLSSMDNFS